MFPALKTSHSSKSNAISWDSKLLSMLFTSCGRVGELTDANETNQWHLVHITTAEGLDINRDSERSSGQVSENTAGDNMKYTSRDHKKVFGNLSHT